MIVLDYLKKTKSETPGLLVIPPFHTGHLGLIPDTSVNLYLMPSEGPPPQHAEILVAPFLAYSDNLMSVTCSMWDRRGVVSALMDAISSLNVNVVTQESAAINKINHHYVNLVLDWTTSPFYRVLEPTSDAKKQRYRRYTKNIDLDDPRQVLLFEAIVAHCADVLLEEDSIGGPSGIPQLYLRRMETVSRRQSYDMATVKKWPPKQRRASGKSTEEKTFKVSIQLEGHLLSSISALVGRKENSGLDYIVLSDTDTRMLRVFFPATALQAKIVHLGFSHADIPGTISAILRVLSREFNILTSLLRKKNQGRSIWEAILEYRGEGDVERDRSGKKTCEWVGEKLAAEAQSAGPSIAAQIRFSQVKIGLPSYPGHRYLWREEVDLTELMGPAPAEELEATALASGERRLDDRRAALLEQHRKDLRELIDGQLKETPHRLPRRDLQRELLEIVGAGVGQQQPKIFLSYPGAAALHAAILRDRLKQEGFEVVEHQVGDGDIIVDAVARKIEACDGFVALWHHDEQQRLGDGFGISPWMPFEFAIARALNKRTIIAHSDRLSQGIWGRIDAGESKPQYSDRLFSQEIPKLVGKRCKQWLGMESGEAG